jgi:hypothetical protein
MMRVQVKQLQSALRSQINAAEASMSLNVTSSIYGIKQQSHVNRKTE